MNGDFKTDITRDSFRRHKNFSRVLMQQGRVQLDADWNEQTDILLYYVRSLASDIIGPHAGPIGDVGFAIGKYTPPPPSKSAISDSGSKGWRTRRSKGSDQQATDSSVGAYTVSVTRGHYYVDGILCELNENIEQYVIEDEEVDAAKSAQNNTSSNQFQNAFLFYLDVWEREVTYQEDDSIREVALGGPDTATRAQVVSQVRAKALASLGKLIIDDTQKRQGKLEGLLGQQPVKASGDFTDAWTDFVQKYAHMFPAMTSALPPNILQLGPAYLKARTLIPEGDEYTDPCTIPPASKYRGAENQLYRAEVHTSGIGRPNPNQPQQGRIQGRQSSNQAGGRDSEPPQKGDSRPASGSQYATFKWSRENGSVVFPITSNIDPGTFDTLTVSISDLGRDDSRFSLNVDDWVEILDYEDTLELEPGNLMHITAVDYINMQVSLAAPEGQMVDFDTDSGPRKPKLLRRWDYHRTDPDEKGATTLDQDGALEIIENHWLTLEDGIQVQFHHEKPDSDADDLTPYYHTGDYWLIPARAALGDIEWPHHGNEHEALFPHGIKHHYAPLALVLFNKDGKITEDLQIISLQRRIIQGWEAIVPK